MIALQQLGPYRLTRLIGRGGMSSVYEAEDTRIGRRVAVKVVSQPSSRLVEDEDTYLLRMRHEASIIARMSHPNVVTIYDVGEQDDLFYLVMEYLNGTTLAERIQREGPLPLWMAEGIVHQIADGLDSVHAAGIVHRDLKPTNIMLLPDREVRGGYCVKILDFGVARMTDDSTRIDMGVVMGTPLYLAPELTRGGRATPASDIWSFGVLLHEMLTGRPPFTGELLPTLVYKIVYESPSLSPGLSPGIQEVLRYALEKDPERRFVSGRALANAFSLAISEASGSLIAESTPALPLGGTTINIPAYTRGAPLPNPVVFSERTQQIAERTTAFEEATVVGEIPPQGSGYPMSPPETERIFAPNRSTRDVLTESWSTTPVSSRFFLPVALALMSILVIHTIADLNASWSPRDRNDFGIEPLLPPPTSVVRTTPAPPTNVSGKSAAKAITADRGKVQKGIIIEPVASPAAIIQKVKPTLPIVIVREVAPPRPPTEAPLTRSEAGRVKSPDFLAIPAHRSVEPPASNTLGRQNNVAIPPEPSDSVNVAQQPAPTASGEWLGVEDSVPPEEMSDIDEISPSQQDIASRSSSLFASNQSAIHRELQSRLASWSESSVRRDVDRQMDLYAPFLEQYFTKKHVSRDYIRKQRERIFKKTNWVDVDLSEVKIDVGSDGQSAVTRFRKDYDIVGGPASGDGAVIQELHWRRWDASNDWKIVSERVVRILRR